MATLLHCPECNAPLRFIVDPHGPAEEDTDVDRLLFYECPNHHGTFQLMVDGSLQKLESSDSA